MAVRITITDGATGKAVDIDVEPTHLMDDLIESAASYWNLDLGAYVLNRGDHVLQGTWTASQLNFQAGETLNMIPDPTGG